MCGFLGILSPDPVLVDDEDRVLEAMSFIYSRGPDQQRIVRGRRFGIVGSTRLAVRDLENGAQPFLFDNNRGVLLYNGELYQVEDIFNILDSHNLSPRTRCDTEYLALLVKALGPKAFAKLNGEFAFAVIDVHAMKAYLVRDYWGTKPLYYSTHNAGLYFSSSLRSILHLKSQKPHISSRSLGQMAMSWGIAPDRSPFESILQIPPRHYLAGC